jgi:hypothetical protein
MALRLVTGPEEQTTPTVGLTAAAITGLIDSVPAHPVALTAAEITGLIGLFQQMLGETEKRILAALAANSKGAADRWQLHDTEQTLHREAIAGRFAKLESALTAHLDRQHDEDVAMDARIRPIRGSLAWVWAQRRDIVIVLIGIGVLATFLVESFNRILGPHVP